MSDNKALIPIQQELVALVDRQLALTEKLLATTRSPQDLIDVFFVPCDGSIEDAVKKVRPGGTIKIVNGKHYIEHGILVDKPLRIEGEGMEETSVSYGSHPMITSDVSDEDAGSNYLFNFITKGKVEIENICFDMNDKYLNCLLMICADEVHINNCRLIGNGQTDSDDLLCGLLLYGDTEGVIQNCIVKKCQNGIILAYNNASTILVGNRCEENEGSGICFASSSKAIAVDNVCRRNKVSGISVQNESSPTLSGNFCEENGEDGIIFMNLSTGTAYGNFCRLNKSDGIQVQNEAYPTLIGNRCNENGDCGIVFMDSSTGTVTNNICQRNASVGILVLDKSSPSLSGSSCKENGEDDITFME